VLAQERDLLDTAFLRRNARTLGLDVITRETLFVGEAAEAGSLPLIVGELSAPAGPLAAAREMQDAATLLAPAGVALILATSRQEREWFPAAAPKKAALSVLLRREGATVLRISRRPGS
jgi:hypothetical protein